jgi:hypothetical protein
MKTAATTMPSPAATTTSLPVLPPTVMRTPQQPSQPDVVTTLSPPCPAATTTTPTMPITPPNPTTKEVFLKAGDILPAWKHTFILEHLPTMLGNKKFFKAVQKRNEPNKDGVCILNQMCGESPLLRCGSKTLLIQRLVG